MMPFMKRCEGLRRSLQFCCGLAFVAPQSMKRRKLQSASAIRWSSSG